MDGICRVGGHLGALSTGKAITCTMDNTYLSFFLFLKIIFYCADDLSCIVTVTILNTLFLF